MLINIVVKTIAYSVIILLMFMLMRKHIIRFLIIFIGNSRFKAIKNTSNIKLFTYTYNVFCSLYDNPSMSSVYYFWGLIVFLFLVSFIILFLSTSLLLSSLLIALCFSSLPYLFIISRISLNRIKASYEGERIIIDLLYEYKTNNNNMQVAFDNVSNNISGNKFVKNVLLKLSKALLLYKSPEHLRASIDLFIFAFNTEWSRLLGDCIYNAIFKGYDVSPALDNIIIEIKQIKIIIEDMKAENHTALKLMSFLNPLLFIASFFVMPKFLGVTLNKYLHIISSNILLSQLMFLTIFLVVFGIVFYNIVKTPKFDF